LRPANFDHLKDIEKQKRDDDFASKKQRALQRVPNIPFDNLFEANDRKTFLKALISPRQSTKLPTF
jgi:hypothetical protein